MMLLGDPDRLVARSSMLSPGPPPAQRDDPARRRAQSSNACYLYRRCQVKLCGSLGSWLTVVIDFKRWRGMDIRLGKHAHLDSVNLAPPILPIACPFCPSQPILAQTECHRPRLDAGIVPSVPRSRCRSISPPLGSNTSDSCTHPLRQVPPCRRVAACKPS